jgi:toxin ParE1/3/4
MRYRVRILADAEEDLHEIFRHVALYDCPERAWSLLENLERRCSSLTTLANRGHIPPELRAVGVTEYREIHFKPYRIFYRVESGTVYVYAVLDGRRELTGLLQRRLLR